MKNKKKTSCQRIKKEYKKRKLKKKKNQDYVRIEYMKNLFKEDYYKPIKTKGAKII